MTNKNEHVTRHLQIGGCDALELASRFGTPLHVLDAGRIRAACRDFHEAAARHFGPSAQVFYASKALCVTAVLKMVDAAGLGVDVASGGELYTALHAGIPAEKIIMHGNNKTSRELSEALSAGVGRIVVDNADELERLAQLCAQLKRPADILLRIKPGVAADTHAFIRTGAIDSKFGVALEEGEAERVLIRASRIPQLRVRGLHCHIGSQIMNVESFAAAARVMVSFMAAFAQKTGLVLEELNLGGGYGVRYVEADRPRPPHEVFAAIAAAVRSVCDAAAFPLPRLIVEPGRAIVAEAGVTLYTVGAVKQIPGVRTYVSVDGGMYENPRYALYGARYEMLRADDVEAPRQAPVTIAGKCCESGDLLQEHIAMPSLRSGDVIAVMSTGAYHYSMASNYNRNVRPAVVLCENGRAVEIVRRETYEDLVRNDRIPEGI